VSIGASLAATITRAILLFYPPSFRRDAGAPLLDDVRRRARDLDGAQAIAVWWWLLRLIASLLWNGGAAWIDVLRAVSFPSVSWLDLKLACRMLVRYPGLTATAGLGITLSMVIAVGFFSTYSWYFHPAVPLPEGERMVGLENRNRLTYQAERHSLYDFVSWRDQLNAVEDISAFRTIARNLIVPGRAIEQIFAAEITPSGFRLARVPPMLGRALIQADAAPGAPPVIVIGFDVWKQRFDSAPDVIGRAVRLGSTLRTIVGVMPEGFGFPINHQYWVPLAIEIAPKPGEGPAVYISARLKPGTSMDAAQAELAVIGTQHSAQFPGTHANLRPEVMPYTYPFAGMTRASSNDLGLINFLFSLVLIVVCANVAILVYARTATRMGELAVRSALGASRGRIVGQLFAESLVLSGAAAALGVWIVMLALEWATWMHRQPEFWRDYRLPGAALAYAAGLALLAAVITGVLPALQATGRRLQTNLMHFNYGAALRLGGTWTSLVVVQVAIAVATVPIIVALSWSQVHALASTPQYAVDQYVTGVLAADSIERLARRQADLSQRLDSEPGFSAHAFVRSLPGLEPSLKATVDDGPIRYPAQSAAVDSNFFSIMDLPVLAGRNLLPLDGDDGAADVVLINRAFADRLGSSALGRKVRYVEEDPANPSTAKARVYEIVGVVENAETNLFNRKLIEPRVYHPLKRADRGRAMIVVRLRGIEATAAADALRNLVAAVDPNVTVDTIPLSVLYERRRVALTIAGGAVGIAAASVLLLSAAGIYALMSFTVAQRRREIAIRMALGAQPGQLLGGIFTRALRQIGIGVIAGIGLALLIDATSDYEALMGYGKPLLSAMIVIISMVGLLAAYGPARRGLRIQPSAALKGD
jgi:putative ABC transport system permease protein